MILLFIIPILIIILDKNDSNKQRAAKNEQLLSDYPELISKFSILTLAGMSISSSLKRIADDYTKRLAMGDKKRHVYEEIINTCQQLKNGVYEAYAYEDMGRRYGLPCYIKFSSLLISGLKRGTADFNRHLSEEATTAMLEHKSSLLQKGALASTKLLGPMMMIFVVILMLVMIPAFFSMDI